jgi:type IV secretory pathway VirD2 relaxase
MSGTEDYRFRPRLGSPSRQSDKGAPSMKGFLKSARRRGGSSASRVRSRTSSFVGGRQVYIQARIQRLGGSGAALQRAHLSYLGRDGAGRGEERAKFYTDELEALSGQDWLKDHSDERHQFRFIVSPEDGAQLGDLQPFVRDLMSQMEIDLETNLDWIAVDHFNTDHPHSHIVMSGRRDDGTDLVIPRNYLSHGLRERGSALVTRTLGLQTEAELSAKLEREQVQRRVTRMDRVLERQMQHQGPIDLGGLKRNQNHYRARLQALQRLGLAEHEIGMRWRVDGDLTQKLKAIEKSDTVAKRIERALDEAGLDRINATDGTTYDGTRQVTGRLLKAGHSDELIGSRYAIVDGLDGRAHHVELGAHSTKDLSAGDIIEVKPRAHGALKMDREMFEVAAANEGLYSRAAHLRNEPRVTRQYLDMCERRLQALERQGLVGQSDGTQRALPSAFLDKVNDHFAKLAKQSPSIVRKLEHRDFEQQVEAIGDTWLDQQLAGTASEILSEAGLGSDVREAMVKRIAVLRARGIVKDLAVQTLNQDQVNTLQRQGMDHASKVYAKQTEFSYAPLQAGETVTGKFEETLQVGASKYVVVERGHQFALVPWSRELERQRHKQIQIAMSPRMELS